MSETEVIKPYEGPPATPNNFADAFPEIVAAVTGPKRGRNPLDAQSQRNLDDLRRQVRANPFKPATVINLHPWPLSSNDRFIRGIVIPACEPGMDFAHHHIRSWSHDYSYAEDGQSFKFLPIKPIEKATQFLVKFADPEVYGGGVIVYEGESHPNKMGRVELYNPDGRPQVDLKNAIEYDDEDHPVPTVQEIPIMGELSKMIAEQRQRRNAFYKARVEWADSKSKSKNDSDRRLITDQHRLMAEMLHAEGVLPALPDWNLASRMELGLSASNCKSCGNPTNKTGYACGSCGNIIDALAAYLDHKIEFTHAKMEMLSSEQMEVAVAEEAEREKKRAKLKKAK